MLNLGRDIPLQVLPKFFNLLLFN